MLPSGCAGVGHAGRDGIDSSPNGYLAFDAVDFAGVVRRGGHERAAADRGRFALGIGADDRDRAGGVLIKRQDFQIVLKEFLGAAKDYHVNAHFYSTEEAHLPFTVKGAEGRYFIAHINRLRAPTYSFPFEVGGRLAEICGSAL